MATGSHPFAKKDPSHVLTAILQQQPNPPAKVNPHISAELDRIILKCLEKEPENRYRSVKEIATDLLQSAFPSCAARPERAFALRNTPWKAIAAAALALGALLGVIIFVLYGHSVHALTGSDTVVLAEFDNRTGDSVFDDALNQALTIELEQSPFLKIVPQSKTREMLTLMGRSPDQPITPDVAREVCQRTSGKAVLSGSIASLGTDYVIGLRATGCTSGNDLANEQAQFAKKESVLKVLSKAASRMRGKLGESLSSLQQFDTPLEQATTPSLEALKAYSLGRKAQYQQGNSAAIPFFKRAVELDPNFAVAYSALGIVYSNLGEPGLANDNFQRAYDLRERVSEREKLRIAAAYHSYFDGDLVKGSEIYELWAHAYPRDAVPAGNLGAIYLYIGDYQKAVGETLAHLNLEPDNAVAYTNLMVGYTALNRLDMARAAYQQAIARKVDDLGLHGNLYAVAFLQDDTAEMERQFAWAADKPGSEDVLLSFASDTEAFYGRLSKARTLSSRAVDSARRNAQIETAAGWQINSALREAEFGNATPARQATSFALALAPTRDVQVMAALTLARAGELLKAQQLAEGLGKGFPHDTLINGYWLPTIRAAIEIHRTNASKATGILESTVAYELGEPSPLFQAGGSLYPVYLRAQAYLSLGRGPEAAKEFQKILDHGSILVNCPLSALSHLGLARALAVSGDRVEARLEYRNFLTIWKDADPSIPILRQAKAEYTAMR
jgi:tetratricopeptide (TPR) repeat protein